MEEGEARVRVAVAEADNRCRDIILHVKKADTTLTRIMGQANSIMSGTPSSTFRILVL